jgi:HAD superfamily hydrolase (TIGR01509 family)
MGARMSQPQLVIFDCDGVLVDSEPVANRLLGQMLSELGLDLTQEQIFQNFVGYSLPHCLRVIEGMLGRPPPENFPRELQARTFAAFKTELRAMPGIEHALDALDAARVPFCVASSGDHEKMNTTLGITGLLPRFVGRIFSVTQVAHGKPAPDVYLFAARQLGAEPSACVVVEDTPPGVQAGVSAGMTVFGFCAHTPEQKLKAAGAHRTFDDLRRLPEWISG